MPPPADRGPAWQRTGGKRVVASRLLRARSRPGQGQGQAPLHRRVQARLAELCWATQKAGDLTLASPAGGNTPPDPVASPSGAGCA